MKKIGVVANTTKPHAVEVLQNIADISQKLSLDLATDLPTSKIVPGLMKAVDNVAAETEVIVALGGDGTMLRVIRETELHPRPVMGVNIGGLGFLTSVGTSDLEFALRCLARDDYRISKRAMLECVVVENGSETDRYRALNDAVLTNGSPSRVVELAVSVNKDMGTSYICDGIIISTPSGSTGHSLSAGGPIVTPETRALVVSLICPHSLSSRPLVVPDSSEITVKVMSCAGDVLLTVDGQVGRSLSKGDSVNIHTSPSPASLVQLPGYSYFSVLRKKLHWVGSNMEQ